ncbi:MAG: hypothetical protein H7839_17310 [Magnetococcus sp. YQC-5]
MTTNETPLIVENYGETPSLPKEVELNKRPIYESDKWIYRVVVLALSFSIPLCLIGAIYLVMHDKEVPEVLIALGSASIGAVAGLLSPKRG